MTTEAIELAKDALHFLYVAGGVFVALVALLVRASYSVGATLAKVEHALGDLPEIKAETRKIPIIECKVAAVQEDVAKLQQYRQPSPSAGGFGE